MKKLFTIFCLVICISACSTIDKVETIESEMMNTMSPNINNIQSTISDEIVPKLTDASKDIKDIESTLDTDVIPKQVELKEDTSKLKDYTENLQYFISSVNNLSKMNSRNIDTVITNQSQLSYELSNAMILIQLKLDQQRAIAVESQEIQSNALISLLSKSDNQGESIKAIQQAQKRMAKTIVDEFSQSKDKANAFYDNRIRHLESEINGLESKLLEEKQSNNYNKGQIEALEDNKKELKALLHDAIENQQNIKNEYNTIKVNVEDSSGVRVRIAR